MSFCISVLNTLYISVKCSYRFIELYLLLSVTNLELPIAVLTKILTFKWLIDNYKKKREKNLRNLETTACSYGNR